MNRSIEPSTLINENLIILHKSPLRYYSHLWQILIILVLYSSNLQKKSKEFHILNKPFFLANIKKHVRTNSLIPP